MFKKKKKKRMTGGFFTPRRQLSEQEYVDAEFKSLKDDLAFLEEQIEILKNIVTNDYILIHPMQEVTINSECLCSDDARERVKELGYTYVRSFENSGELWIKEAPKEKK